MEPLDGYPPFFPPQVYVFFCCPSSDLFLLFELANFSPSASPYPPKYGGLDNVTQKANF